MPAIVVGYAGKLSLGGAPVNPGAAEATTQVGGTKEYQITNAVRRVLDPNTAIVIKDGVSTVSPANYTINLMKGSVTFVSTYTVGGAVTFASGYKYIPRAAIAKVSNFEGAPVLNTADATMIGANNPNGYEQRLPTTLDFSGSFTIFNFLADQSLQTYVTNKTPMLLELDFDGTGSGVTRAWVIITACNSNIKPKELNNAECSFTLYDQSLAANALNGTICNAAFDFVVT
jgi:hypothetical protein